LQTHLAELQDIEKKLPELRTKSTNLATACERLQREVDAQQRGIGQLEADLQSRKEAARSATAECDKAIADQGELVAQAKRVKQVAEEVALIPTEDLSTLERDLEGARANEFRLKHLSAERTSGLDELSKVITHLEQGVRRYPDEVMKTLEALRQAG